VQLFKLKLGRYLKPVRPTKIIIINNNYNNTEPAAVRPGFKSYEVQMQYTFGSVGITSNSPKLF